MVFLQRSGTRHNTLRESKVEVYRSIETEHETEDEKGVECEVCKRLRLSGMVKVRPRRTMHTLAVDRKPLKQDTDTATHASPSNARKYRPMSSASNSLGGEADSSHRRRRRHYHPPSKLLEKSPVPAPRLPPACAYDACVHDAIHVAGRGLPGECRRARMYTERARGSNGYCCRCRQHAVKSESWRYVCVGVHAGHARALKPVIVPRRAGRQQSTVGST